MVAVCTSGATKQRGADTTSGDQVMYKLVSSVASEALGIGKSVGVLTVLGGKASCRRKFVFNVHLLDETGQLASRDMAIVASVAYAHDRSPVLRNEKPFLAEPPLFTTFNGVEFPAQDRPTRMVSGRASFKLAISLLSSKCDNRLFCICFTPHVSPDQKALCLPCYSKPIRSISRKRTQVAHVCVPLPLNDNLNILSQDLAHRRISISNETSPQAAVQCDNGVYTDVYYSKGGSGSTDPKSSIESPTSSSADEDDIMTPQEQQVPGSSHSSSITSLHHVSPRSLPNHCATEPPMGYNHNNDPLSSSQSPSPPMLNNSRDNVCNSNGNRTLSIMPPAGSSVTRPFRPYASVGACKLPGLSDSVPLIDSTTNFKLRHLQSGSAPLGPGDVSLSPPTQNLLERVRQLSSISPQQKVDTIFQSFSLGHCGGNDQALAEFSLEEEEKTLQYLEANLQEMTHELQRRKEEVRSKRRRLIEDEARMHSIIIQSSSWIESLSGRFSM